ncbi:MAG TPA: hypothetical protein VLF40_05970 [Candidatus Saccharimonadales bacterium]|nr:hypothetical protein [Candidatus Saccharimonadales bacterium]
MVSLSTIRSFLIARKLKLGIGLAALVVLIICVFLLMPGGKPQKQADVQTRHTATVTKGNVLGANTATNADEGTATDASTTPVKDTPHGSNPSQSSAPAPTNTDPGTTPNPTKPDPCASATNGGTVTQTETKVSFVESVTIPVGCTTGPFTLKTTDGRTVNIYGFTNKPTSPVKAVMASTGVLSSATYTVVITDAATPGYYEDFAMVEDPSFPGGAFAVTIKITVIARP